MFSEFENVLKKVKYSVKQQVRSVVNNESDYALIPQKYVINGRQIHEIKLLSQGAFGFIWLAQDIVTKQQFALKRVICMTEERLLQSKNEKEVLSLLPKSKYIVEYFGSDIIDRDKQTVIVILMELCDGGTLFDLLEENKNVGISEQKIISIIIHILKGLEVIHSAGYYHRDIKIENVLAGKDGTYKLCDFGSCTKQTYNFAEINKSEYDSIKQDIETKTTPMYRPPEIVDPYAKYFVNYKVDIWMVGCVLYTLNYFTHPFFDSNEVGIISGCYRFPKYPTQTQYLVSDKMKDLIRHLLTPIPNFRPSPKQLIVLLKNWKSVEKIPLNPEAVRRKKQELQREQQLEKLNKNCLDFEGDIPIEKIMELQKKLKKNPTQDQVTSFVNKNQFIIENSNPIKWQSNKIKNYQAPKNIVKNPPITKNPKKGEDVKNPFGPIAEKQSVQKKKTDINQLWANNFSFEQKPSNFILEQKNLSNQPRSSNGNSLDFFNNFGSSNQKPNPNECHQTLNFEQMFCDTPLPNRFLKNNVKTTKTTENLLDF